MGPASPFPQVTICGPSGQRVGFGTSLLSPEHGAHGGLQRAEGPDAHLGPRGFQLVTQHPTHLVALPTGQAFLLGCQVPDLGTLSCLRQPLPLWAGGWALAAPGALPCAVLRAGVGFCKTDRSFSLCGFQCVQGMQPLAGLWHPCGKASPLAAFPCPTSACPLSRPGGFILSLSGDPELQLISIILIRHACVNCLLTF